MKDNLQIIEKYTDYGLPYIEIRGCEEFETSHIFDCGQCFRWNFYPKSSSEYNNMYVGVAGGRVISVSTAKETAADTQQNVIILANVTKNDFDDFWYDYFDFSRDYRQILSVLSSKDEHINDASKFGQGIRILRQEHFETLISFIISSNNNIPRIKGCIEKICRSYGEKIKVSEAFTRYLAENSDIAIENIPDFYAFPKPEVLAKVTADEYSICCKAGYRCAYLEKTAGMYINEAYVLEDASMGRTGLSEARKLVKKFSGVGPKVADCVLLFAGLRTDVFPVDVWVRRVLEDLYFHREVSQKEAEKFADEYFGELAGFAQQYLFYAMRETK